MEAIKRCIVCGMEADEDFKSEYNAREYTFCGFECKERFEADPARFASVAM
jgi:YHS domain-containing protein